ncbi:MAG: hypothetical protein K9N51_07805 [Candidatus Pacebacteria bacterium]|nr:hypothetical protein [Candidatus Paceibacterota bacterium]
MKHRRLQTGRAGFDEILLLFVIPLGVLAALGAGAFQLWYAQQALPEIGEITRLSDDIRTEIVMLRQYRGSLDLLTGVDKRLVSYEKVRVEPEEPEAEEPEPEPLEPVHDQSAFDALQLRVVAVILDAKKKVAVVNNKIVPVGGTVVEGVMLKGVTRRGAVFEGPNGELGEVELFHDENTSDTIQH